MVGDVDPDHGFRHAHVTHKVMGRPGGVSVAESVSKEDLSTGLVPDLEGVPPEGGEEPEFPGAGTEDGVDGPF